MEATIFLRKESKERDEKIQKATQKLNDEIGKTFVSFKNPELVGHYEFGRLLQDTRESRVYNRSVNEYLNPSNFPEWMEAYVEEAQTPFINAANDYFYRHNIPLVAVQGVERVLVKRN